MMFVGLLALVISSFGIFAYRGVRDAAVQRASERLSSIADELSASSARSNNARAATLASVAADSSVTSAVSDAPLPRDGPRRQDVPGVDERSTMRDAARITAALTARRAADDSTWMAFELFDASGQRHATPMAHGRDSSMMMQAVTTVLTTGQLARSPAYSEAGQVRFWTVVEHRRRRPACPADWARRPRLHHYAWVH